MKHEQQVVIKRWIPILKEYEKTRTKIRKEKGDGSI